MGCHYGKREVTPFCEAVCGEYIPVMVIMVLDVSVADYAMDRGFIRYRCSYNGYTCDCECENEIERRRRSFHGGSSFYLLCVCPSKKRNYEESEMPYSVLSSYLYPVFEKAIVVAATTAMERGVSNKK